MDHGATAPAPPRGDLARRTLLTGGAAMAAGLLLPARSLAAPGDHDIAFRVLRGGDDIGTHRLDFTWVGNRLDVRIAVDLVVTFAGIPVFRFTHRNHETWEGDRLVAIETTTDDDGKPYVVHGRRVGDALRIRSTFGDYDAPGGVIPSSYWTPRLIGQTQLLDTRSGKLLPVASRGLGQEMVDTPSGPVRATRYHIDGEITLDIWYAANGNWVKLAFTARGSEVTYRLEGHAA
ncbi:hypothetical protein E9232_000973 [Inquilinus ginsengisoli]|uniref:DUF3108 domain-containing protein n=1 Tax=Inquilinus ginsengisoli TaxID=363840 RepID=A0ABU1JIN4_9PROT|nr:DUF6134 family protein [Inquilinus ginsengisoli]MDR6288466.1 hypothetical protein [Inquilinus ginsengisoli]